MDFPLRFRPIYKDYLWGGRRFESYRGPVASTGPLAESWELSCHPQGPSTIEGGPLDGLTLPDAVVRYGSALLGNAIVKTCGDHFPLLLKLIDARLPLSVQVHPDDATALAREGWAAGKSEAWYVVAAEDGAELVAGLTPGTTREALAAALAAGHPEPFLRSVRVHPGDVVDIPAGRVHAIGAGLLLYEIQQNSDLTYRLFDYHRRDAEGNLRPLHIEKALDAIVFGDDADAVLPARPPLPVRDAGVSGDVRRRALVSNDFFELEEWTLADGATRCFAPDDGRFEALTCVEGAGLVRWTDGEGTEASLRLRTFETVMIPASLGAYALAGPVKVLRALPGAV